MVPNALLANFRNIGDTPADDVVNLLMKDKSFLFQVQSLTTNQSLFKLQKSINLAEFDFLVNGITSQQPPAVPKLFQKHAPAIMGILGLYALPYCYAAANGARVLIHSRYLIENPEKRLYETASFIQNICKNGAYESSGRGYVTLLKVRLMHAAIRTYAKKYITDEVPINQEDLAGTQLAFSLLIIRGLRKLGTVVNAIEAEEWLKFWYMMGIALGISEKLLPVTLKEATQLEYQIRKRQFRQSDEGIRLTSALVTLMQAQAVHMKLSFQPAELMTAFLGPEISKMLGLKSNPLKDNVFLTLLSVLNFMQSKQNGPYRKILHQLHQQIDDEAYLGLFHLPIR